MKIKIRHHDSSMPQEDGWSQMGDWLAELGDDSHTEPPADADAEAGGTLCGIALPLGLLVPDGGQACTDIRWYCKDAMSCAHRWTTATSPVSAPVPAAPDDTSPDAGKAAPDEASAELPGDMSEAAQPAVQSTPVAGKQSVLTHIGEAAARF
jgi:hypothetical protein